MLVAATDQLEQQVRMPVGVRQVADLVDQQQVRRGIAAQPQAQRRVAVQRRQLAQQLPGGDEQRRMAREHGLVAQVAREQALAQAVGADEDDIGGVGEELQRHQLLDGRTIDLRGPAPVEVGDRL